MDKKDKKIVAELDGIIQQHVLSAVGVGLLPVPGLDFAGLIVVQSNMIKEIAGVYEVPFLKDAVKNILSSLVAASLFSNAVPFLASMVKFIPIVGQAVGGITMSVVCGASTYATGKVFIRHFESGGNLMSFDVEKMKTYYTEMLEEGKRVAKTMKE